VALFEPAAAISLALEGGYQNNPKDKGNYNSLGVLVGTNHGISAKFFEQYFNYVPTVADMKALTAQTAQEIFYLLRWYKYSLSELTDQTTANHVFDLFVNHSPTGATKIVQDSLTSLGYMDFGGPGWGAMTRSQVNLASNEQHNNFNNALVQTRIKYYNSLLSDPDNQEFITGWIIRAKKFLPVIVAGAAVLTVVFVLTLAGLFIASEIKGK